MSTVLTGVLDIGRDTTVIGPSPVVALRGAVVEVFGPTVDVEIAW